MSTCFNGCDSHVKAARKRHRCDLCMENIDSGQPYFKRTGINFDGGFFVMKMHPECHAHEHTVPLDWYEWPDGEAFTRQEAIAAQGGHS